MSLFNQQLFNQGLFGGGGGGGGNLGLIFVSEIIYKAYRLAGVLQRPQTSYSASELYDGLITLNTMIDAWNVERLNAFCYLRNVFTVKAGQQVYSIGTTTVNNVPPDWVMVRPPKLDFAGFITLQNPAQPLEIPIAVLNVGMWAQVPIKNTPSTLGLELWFEPTVPNATATFWPTPTIDNQVALYARQLLGSFTSDQNQVVLPYAYRAALEYNLAVELNAGHPEANMKAQVPLMAEKYKAAMMRGNVPILDIQCDPAVVARERPWNWLTDGYTR